MNVLITSASRKVSLIRAFQKALKQEGGGEVVAIDSSPLSPALYFADKHYLLPPTDSPDFIDIILKLCKQLSISLIVPTRDEELALFAEHKQMFKKYGITVMVSDISGIKICQNKKSFIKFCQENGFATPKCYSSDEITQSLFPLFAKPQTGKGGQQAEIIKSKEELEILLKENPEMIIQEFIDATEYTIDIFADFSGEVISVVPRERIKIFNGESFISRTFKNDLLIKESAKLIKKLKLIGHNTIQCFLCNDKIKFIEINPRFGGAANLGFVSGAPTPLYLIKLLKGEKLKPRIGDFKDGYIMLRYTDDLFLNKEEISNKKYI